MTCIGKASGSFDSASRCWQHTKETHAHTLSSLLPIFHTEPLQTTQTTPPRQPYPRKLKHARRGRRLLQNLRCADARVRSATLATFNWASTKPFPLDCAFDWSTRLLGPSAVCV